MLLTGKQKHRNKLHVGINGAHWYTKYRNKLHVAGDAAYWFTKHRNKLHVGCHHENQCDETIQQSLSEPDSNPLHQ